MLWYAAQRDRSDSWDNGSFDYNTAAVMLQDYIRSGYESALIAVIDEYNVCIDEIEEL